MTGMCVDTQRRVQVCVCSLGDVHVEVSQELPLGGRVPREDGVAELTHLGLQLQLGQESPIVGAPHPAVQQGAARP